MRRRLSEDERNNLYQKWGISLHSKHRRLQSANLLWSNTQNLDHIMDSATIIAKLVGSVEPEQAFKEMFGLRFAPRDTVTKRKSHFWLESFKSIALEMVRKASLVSCKNFVDLAGSERASQTLSAGARLKEGCHINRSLLTLGTVIRKLSSSIIRIFTKLFNTVVSRSKGRSGHVPYRDSKLTRILQSSLGGNARTAIICTMSPAHSHVEQSRNTLLFASCAKEVTTSAQVNVVMSDKALVKHLQKELTRLENELRGSGHKIVSADSSTILREKDLQIEKLKKEVSELTQQRDLAQSQVKDLVRVLGDDKPSEEDLERYYPKLRGQVSWDFEMKMAGAPVRAVSRGRANSVRSFGTSQYSDGDSRTSSEETLFQLPDLEENFMHTDSSRQLSDGIPNFVDGNLHQEESKEQFDGNSEDFCKEVRCIEMEESGTNRYIVSNISDSSASRYQNSNMSSPFANTATSGLTTVENGDGTNQELESPLPKQKGFVVPSSERTPQWLPEKEMSCPSVKLQARLMNNSSPWWLELVEKNESTPAIEFEKKFIGRPEGFQKKLPSLNYGAETERLPRNASQAAARSAAIDERKAQDTKSTTDDKVTESSTLVEGAEETTDTQCNTQLADSVVPETDSMPIPSPKDVKDVGLDPMPIDDESPSRWPSEFNKLQREIVELWDACNVSLVHRTYFFLLFKGDPSDSIYMEVEVRRLSFLKDTFSRGNQTLEDGQTLTPASSMKALTSERHMLSKQMRRRLSEDETNNLYLKWGISLHSKHRRLQLANLLWSNTQNLDHIMDSATIVAKLVGSVEPEQAFKEMFGLRFAPRDTLTKRKSHFWSESFRFTAKIKRTLDSAMLGTMAEFPLASLARALVAIAFISALVAGSSLPLTLLLVLLVAWLLSTSTVSNARWLKSHSTSSRMYRMGRSKISGPERRELRSWRRSPRQLLRLGFDLEDPLLLCLTTTKPFISVAMQNPTENGCNDGYNK
ncbi:hypothetical protein DVH24_034124 [Malus domestica]|uniref:Kinesin motor domain-containing protein n=1 Tax=Malus domestica TaxID=3750 RepID=A0A498KGJ1_MALDO|nr:hypothetical protein DVH24_034124 [Malus domestica]